MGIIRCSRHGIQGMQMVSQFVAASMDRGDAIPDILSLTVERDEIEFVIYVEKSELKFFENFFGAKADEKFCITSPSDELAEEFLGMVENVCGSCFREFREKIPLSNER